MWEIEWLKWTDQCAKRETRTLTSDLFWKFDASRKLQPIKLDQLSASNMLLEKIWEKEFLRHHGLSFRSAPPAVDQTRMTSQTQISEQIRN